MLKKLESRSWSLALVGLLAVIFLLWISGEIPASLGMTSYTLAWISLFVFNPVGAAFGVINLIKLSKSKKSTEKIHAIAGIISNIVVFFGLLSLMVFGLISG